MNKNKRKLSTESNIISDELSKKIKTSYVDEDDSNALILTSKKKTTSKEAKVSKEVPKLLSKKQRKVLEKKIRTKEQKSSIKSLYAELEAFNQLKPETAIASLKDDIKTQPKLFRTNLTEKIKPVSTKKLKSWQKQRNKNHVENEANKSPDTSDFSSDEDEEDDVEMKELEQVEVPDQLPTLHCNSNTVEESKKIDKPRDDDEEAEKPTPNLLKPRPLSYVLVNRSAEVQEARLQLPILAEETAIMEAISESDVVILSGATGCGKTTQVPQFLYEAGYTKDGLKIGITEPRRVAAMSMAKRVAHELECENSNLVSYHIRYDKKATCSTQIKFMTDGVLLQEMKQDPMLNNYSAIIIDEAHERSVYSDMLIGFLSIIVRARRRDFDQLENSTENKDQEKKVTPLKLIIMSATLRVSDFAENKGLFPGSVRPPVIDLPSRQYPVHAKFNKQTNKKYLDEAFKKVVEVHETYPEGGILVFLTGQQEVLTMCKWLKSAFPVTDKFLNRTDNEEKVKTSSKVAKEAKEDELIKVNLNDFSIIPVDEESELTHETKSEEESDIVDESDDEEEGIRADIQSIINGAYTNINLENPIHALPLYSLLPIEKQGLVFQNPPAGQRLVVVATNVAETSITIPNIKYVIDCGMEKVKKWDPVTGISRFELGRISKSSAEQRAGRAGRVGPGFCFRLYSSAVFEELKPFADPEIVQRPIEDVVLMLRNYIHSSIPIHKFCLPTIPSETAIAKAEKILLSLGALNSLKLKSGTVTEITDLGKCMTQIPLNPRFARMLLMANQHGLLPYAVLMVSSLSVSNFFVTGGTTESTGDDASEKAKLANEFKRKFVQKRADLLFGDASVLLGAMCLLERVSFELRDETKTRQVAENHGVRWQAFVEVRKLRKQLTDILNSNVKNLDLAITPCLPQPTSAQFEHLRQLVLSGSAGNVARRAPINLSCQKDQKQKRRERGMYQCSSIDAPVYIHTDSVLNRDRYEWVIFQDLYTSSVNGQEHPKPYMRNVTVIEPEWLPIFCTLDCKPEGLVLNHLVDNERDQLPYYDDNHDCIMACAKKILFGRRNLQLPEGTRIPLVAQILEDDKQRDKMRRWFAKFFMDGAVFPKMESWRQKFKSSCKPDLILNPIGSHRSEVKSIIKNIYQLTTPCKKSICDKWKEDSNYLLSSYLEWVLPEEHEFIIANWPPIDEK